MLSVKVHIGSLLFSEKCQCSSFRMRIFVLVQNLVCSGHNYNGRVIDLLRIITLVQNSKLVLTFMRVYL